jgi:putative oxidoreductase
MSEITTTPATSRERTWPVKASFYQATRAARSGLSTLSFVAPLLTRIVIGLAFFQAGLGKWRHLDGTADFFAGLGIPLPGANAVFIAVLEMVGGLLLIPGLASRAWAFLLTCTMAVALITADAADFVSSWASSSDLSPTDVTAFTFLLFLLWLVLYGPGAASIDHVVSRWSRQKTGPSP